MKYCIDLDGTLCTNTWGNYHEAEPLWYAIEEVNRLKNAGHVIKIFTARGTTSGKDWTGLTENQLDSWGVMYDELIMNVKPPADFFIDDIAINAIEWHKNLQKKKKSVVINVKIKSVLEFLALKNITEKYNTVFLSRENTDFKNIIDVLVTVLPFADKDAKYEIEINSKEQLMEHL